MLNTGDTVRWQMAGCHPWYAVVIGQPAGAMDGFYVLADEQRALIAHARDCLVLPSRDPRNADRWRARYLEGHPGGLKP